MYKLVVDIPIVSPVDSHIFFYSYTKIGLGLVEQRSLSSPTMKIYQLLKGRSL